MHGLCPVRAHPARRKLCCCSKGALAEGAALEGQLQGRRSVPGEGDPRRTRQWLMTLSRHRIHGVPFVLPFSLLFPLSHFSPTSAYNSFSTVSLSVTPELSDGDLCRMHHSPRSQSQPRHVLLPAESRRFKCTFKYLPFQINTLYLTSTKQ